LVILHELGMLPEQFQFKNGIPDPNKIQDLELLPIKKGSMQLVSLVHYKLRVRALGINKDDKPLQLKELGKIFYQFNQLRGYAGGNNDEDTNKKKGDDAIEETDKKKYEVIVQKVEIIKVDKSDSIFKVRGGANKGQEMNKYNATIIFEEEKLEGETELQNLEDKIGKVEELEIRIKRNKNGETSYVFALPKKTNWRKQMETTEEALKNENLYISQLIVNDLEKNKWTKIRNRVFLRHRFKEEFDAIWDFQYDNNPKFKKIVDDKDKMEQIINYIFPERDRSMPETEQSKKSKKEEYRAKAREKGLKFIIRDQVIYYQRPLKSQEELISTCQFEKSEKVVANSYPLFQEFRCWDQINRMYITSKQEIWNERKKKDVFKYTDRFLTNEQKQEIYNRLQTQKQLSFSEVAKIIALKNNKTEYLNGLNVKAKLKGCDTTITIRKMMGEHFEGLYEKDNKIVSKIWEALFNNANNGNEYDPSSIKVSSIIEVLKPLTGNEIATEYALRLSQKVRFPRKYASLSKKAIKNILPLMRLNPSDVLEKVRQTFNLVQTGEIPDDFPLDKLEDYVISFIEQNPKAIEMGGLMYAFASSLVYGKHTKETIKPQVKDYHEIKYMERNLRNPIVSQITNETLQVIKAIWKKYKINPEELEIRVELARDLKNSANEREKIHNGQIKNRNINEIIKKTLIELKQEPSQGNIDLYKLWSKQNIEDYPAPKKANEPTQEEIQKLRLWEEQCCISPYTGKPIQLSKLFSPERLFDIDHIIPKTRYFDDSLSNKVVCETHINEEKSNRTAWEYLSQQNSKYKDQDGNFEIFTIENYMSHVNRIFYGRKKKNLLLEKIPTNPVERQLKDTQYISVAIKNELAKIVGSDNVKSSTGEVTSFLRSRWGLKKLFMELTEERFKQMELWDIDPETGSPRTEWIQKYFDKNKEKHIYEIKNWSKRYDHRHHAVDALVVALTKQSHIQRLNNLNKHLQDQLKKRKDEFKLEVKEGETILEAYFNLEVKRREAIQKKLESSRYFEMPFDDLIMQTKKLLQSMIISIKPKNNLGIQTDKEGKIRTDNNGNKLLKIRGALHQETNYGKTKDPNTGILRDTKTIGLTALSIKDIPQIIDDVLKREIDSHRKEYKSMKDAFTGEELQTFNENRFQKKIPEKLKPPVYKVKVWYNSKATEESTLQRLYDSNEKLSVVTGDNYLFLVMELNGKRVFDIASLYDSADIAKRALKEKVENFKQRICEEYRLSYGESHKIKGKPQENPDKVLFTLQKNDLVYLPKNADDPVLEFNNEKLRDWLSDTVNKRNFNKRVYKVVMFTGKNCKFIPHNYANEISIPKDLTENQKEILKRKHADKKGIPKAELNFVEFGSFRDCSPYEMGEQFIKESVKVVSKGKRKTIDLPLIQDHCIKIEVDWLGNISKSKK